MEPGREIINPSTGRPFGEGEAGQIQPPHEIKVSGDTTPAENQELPPGIGTHKFKETPGGIFMPPDNTIGDPKARAKLEQTIRNYTALQRCSVIVLHVV